MSVYLHDIPLSQAQARLREALQDAGLWRVLGSESIPLDENALGRVTSEPIWAKVSSPHYHASAMDGFAVRAEDTNGAQPSTPVQLLVSGNSVNSDSVISQQLSVAQYVDTGDPLPDWANAVIPIENVESLDASGQITSAIRQPWAIRIRAAVTPWSHVRPLGEDIVATQLVLPAGHILRPVDLGAIAAAGHQEINVARKPKVAQAGPRPSPKSSKTTACRRGTPVPITASSPTLADCPMRKNNQSWSGSKPALPKVIAAICRHRNRSSTAGSCRASRT